MAVALVAMRPDGLNKGGLEEKSAWLGQPGRTPTADARNLKLPEGACFCGAITLDLPRATGNTLQCDIFIEPVFL